MTPYYEHGGITIYHGDCRDVLPGLRSIHAVVTDPPYGLSFMGKGWDHAVPGIDFWTAVNDSLAPGAHLLACGGSRTFHRLTCAIEDADFEIRDCLQWLYGSGFPKSRNLGDGKGTALKPAYEPIVLARKRFAGTATACHQEHGTAALNINACRIGTSANEPDSGAMFYKNRGLQMPENRQNYFGGKNSTVQCTPIDGGRWPSNVLLDEEAAAILDEQSGELKSGGGIKNPVGREGLGWKCSSNSRDSGEYAPNIGGASRFYYVAKASRIERGDFNEHPTVKPLALMRYLVRLITPPDGTTCDPFMGSGSSLIAAYREHRKAIGIDLNERYCEIAAKRLSQEVLPLEQPA